MTGFKYKSKPPARKPTKKRQRAMTLEEKLDMVYSGKLELIEQHGKTSRPTIVSDVGLEVLAELAANGSSATEVAQIFGMSPRTLQAKLNDDPVNGRYDARLAKAWQAGRAKFILDLRRNQKNLSEANASMAIHLGKHELNQHDKPQEHHHVHKVVGTLPDYDSTPEAWRRQFAPETLQSVQKHDAEDIEVMAIEVRDDLIPQEED